MVFKFYRKLKDLIVKSNTINRQIGNLCLRAGIAYFKLFDTFTALKYFFLYFLMLGCKIFVSQTDTLRLYQAYPAFSNQEKAEWTGFENDWQFFEYPRLKETAAVKTLSCKSCESFYADVYIEIDENGKTTKAVYLSGKRCGIPTTLPELKTGFEHTVLPAKFHHLKSKKFIARFGSVLKC